MTPKELRLRRHRLGLTQKELADALGYSDRAVRHWEERTRPIPPWLPLALKALEAERKGRK